MQQTTKRNVLKPQYYDSFACAMSACEDNCCKDWSITIDKKTYTKYRNIKNPEFQKKISKSIKRIKDKRLSDYSYAEFVLNGQKRCPFQTEQGLCEIHRDLGEEYLCHTCKIYPRITNSIDGNYLELSLKMSCPEVVRIALFDTMPMEFTAETFEFKENDPSITISCKPAEGKTKTRYLQHSWAMREAAITIMQIRTCPVAYRVIIIAMMLDSIAEAHDEGRYDEIPGILEFYANGTYGEKFLESFNDIELSGIMHIKMGSLMYYMVNEIAKQPNDSTFTELLDRFGKEKDQFDNELAGAGMRNPVREKGYEAVLFYDFIGKLTKAHWRKFTEKWEHVLENYLVSYMFTELFPVSYHAEGLDPYHHSFILAEQYVLFKTLLCSNYDDDEGFSKQYIVHMVNKISAMNQHTKKPLAIAENYKNAGIDSPAHLFYLLI